MLLSVYRHNIGVKKGKKVKKECDKKHRYRGEKERKEEKKIKKDREKALQKEKWMVV